MCWKLRRYSKSFCTEAEAFLFVFSFSFYKQIGFLERKNDSALQLDTLVLICESQRVDFDALLKEVLSICLKIFQYSKVCFIVSAVLKLLFVFSLNTSRYRQCQSKLWYQTDTSGSGSGLTRVWSMIKGTPPPLCSFVVQSRHSAHRGMGGGGVGARFTVRCSQSRGIAIWTSFEIYSK